jgi:hypothetical protein
MHECKILLSPVLIVGSACSQEAAQDGVRPRAEDGQRPEPPKRALPAPIQVEDVESLYVQVARIRMIRCQSPSIAPPHLLLMANWCHIWRTPLS